MRKNSIVMTVVLLIAACASSKDRSASVDTTLPNGTSMLSSQINIDEANMLADNMEMQADNMDAMSTNISTLNGMTAVDGPTGSTYQSTPDYSIPSMSSPEPTPVDDTSNNYGGE